MQKVLDGRAFEKYLREFRGHIIGPHKKLSDQQIAIIRDRVARLPAIERMVVYLWFWEDLTLWEIASYIGVQSSLEAKQVIIRALVRLRDDPALVQCAFRNYARFETEATEGLESAA